MKKIIIYQVFTRLFGNTNPTRKVNGSYTENGCGKLNDFTPKALSEIKDLGITHLWYTGVIEHATQTDYSHYGIKKDYPEIVKGKAGSPYAIKDYYDINPDLAEDVNSRMQEFENLVSRTHEAEMKVIIDFVPNHVARHYHSDAIPENTISLGENDNKSIGFSASNNFYYILNEPFRSPVPTNDNEHYYIEKPAKVTGNDCISAKPGIHDWYETVKLNYGVNVLNGRSTHFNPIPDTWKKMLHILDYWAAKGIDGFRCDMAEMVPVEFWQWAIHEIKKKYPSVIFIAEVYNPELYPSYIQKGGFDYLYDKVGTYDTIKNVIHNHCDTTQITKTWDSLSGIQKHMLSFLENHDEQRLASPHFAGSAEKGIPAMIVSACLYSNPLMLYFGQELGENGMDSEGFSGKDGRTTIFDYWGIERYQQWVNDKKFDGAKLPDESKVLRDWYKNFLNIIGQHKAITEGTLYDLMWYNANNHNFNSKHLFAFLRNKEDALLLIVVNFSDSDEKCRVKIPPHAFFSSGVESKTFFRGKDLLDIKNKISFPQEVAITNGIGVSIKANSGCLFELK